MKPEHAELDRLRKENAKLKKALDLAPWCRLYALSMDNSAFHANRAPRAYAARVKPLTTAALCRRSNVTRGALRIYEREGLIAPPKRTTAGYRDYPPDTVDRLEAVRLLKEIGFSLREIAMLLSERDLGHIDPPELQRMAVDQLAVIDARIERLCLVRAYVSEVAEGNADLIDDSECSFLMRFMSLPRSCP